MIITPVAATASFPAQPWRGTDGSNPLRSSGEWGELCRLRASSADEPREVGWADAFLFGQCGKRRAGAADERSVEAVRPDQQLDQPRIGFRSGKRVTLDQHLDLAPGAAEPRRYGQDLRFVAAARRWRSCNIEQRAEACRPDMDIDLVAPDVDALDQIGKQAALAGCRQLRPALADFRSAHDEPARHRQIGTLRCLVDAAGIEKPLAHSVGYELLDLRGWNTYPGGRVDLVFGDQRVLSIKSIIFATFRVILTTESA